MLSVRRCDRWKSNSQRTTLSKCSGDHIIHITSKLWRRWPRPHLRGWCPPVQWRLPMAWGWITPQPEWRKSMRIRGNYLMIHLWVNYLMIQLWGPQCEATAALKCNDASGWPLWRLGLIRDSVYVSSFLIQPHPPASPLRFLRFEIDLLAHSDSCTTLLRKALLAPRPAGPRLVWHVSHIA